MTDLAGTPTHYSALAGYAPRRTGRNLNPGKPSSASNRQSRSSAPRKLEDRLASDPVLAYGIHRVGALEGIAHPVQLRFPCADWIERRVRAALNRAGYARSNRLLRVGDEPG